MLHTVLLKLIAADPRNAPRTVRVVKGVLDPALKGEGASGRVPHRRRFGENLLHPGIGCEGLAFLNPDAGEQAEHVRVQRAVGFILNDAIEKLVGGEIRRGDGVPRLAGEIKQLHLRRISGFCQWIHPQIFLENIHARLRVAVLQERAKKHPVSEGLRARDKVAFGNVALVAGRQQQILSGLAFVRPGDTDVSNPALPTIIEHPQHARRHFNDQRTILGVQRKKDVGGVVVARQAKRLESSNVSEMMATWLPGPNELAMPLRNASIATAGRPVR